MSINYPFQAIDFAGKFFLSAPSRVMKVQALTWCSGCTFFKGEHIFQLGKLDELILLLFCTLLSICLVAAIGKSFLFLFFLLARWKGLRL